MNKNVEKLKTPSFEAEYSHKNGVHGWTVKNPFDGGSTFFFGLRDEDYKGLVALGIEIDKSAMLRGVGDFSVIFACTKESREQFNALKGLGQVLVLDTCGAIHNAMLNGEDKDKCLSYFKDKNDEVAKFVKAFSETLIDAGQSVMAAPWIFKVV